MEFALILPVLALILLGVIDFGRVFYTYVALANAAREGARYWVLDPGNAAGTEGRVTGELDGKVTLESWSVSSPDLSCPNTRQGCPVTVVAGSTFTPVTPFMRNLTGGPITVRAQATMVVW